MKLQINFIFLSRTSNKREMNTRAESLECEISVKTSSSKFQSFEVVNAVVIALFAAILGITDLLAGKYGDDEIIGNNSKANVYSWYQSKSVKQSLVEGQRDLIQSLMQSDGVRTEHIPALKQQIEQWNIEIDRYKKEKRELLEGSAQVGRANWIQENNGQLGTIIGAREWEARLEILGQSGDLFDRATLFLQLCLVLGAIALIVQQERLKWIFLSMMMLQGVIGSAYAIRAFLLATTVS